MNRIEHLGQMAAPDIGAIPALLNTAGIPTTKVTDIKGPALVIVIEAHYWGRAAEVTAANHIRWSAGGSP